MINKSVLAIYFAIVAIIVAIVAPPILGHYRTAQATKVNMAPDPNLAVVLINKDTDQLVRIIPNAIEGHVYACPDEQEIRLSAKSASFKELVEHPELLKKHQADLAKVAKYFCVKSEPIVVGSSFTLLENLPVVVKNPKQIRQYGYNDQATLAAGDVVSLVGFINQNCSQPVCRVIGGNINDLDITFILSTDVMERLGWNYQIANRAYLIDRDETDKNVALNVDFVEREKKEIALLLEGASQ